MTAPPPGFLRFLDQAVAARGRTGVVGVAAIEEFEVAWTAAAGGAEDCVFQAGSLSKSVTSAVALELVRRGELELDADVGERLLSWRLSAGADPVTLRRLRGHTAGANVPFYPGYPQGGPAPTPTQSLDGVEPTTTDAVVIDPGRAGRFRYSGGGFTVVQQLIGGERLLGSDRLGGRRLRRSRHDRGLPPSVRPRGPVRARRRHGLDRSPRLSPGGGRRTSARLLRALS